jgi:uncharacterized protein (DUF362 family)
LESTIKVAVVRTDRRRGGVAEALALIAAELGQRVALDSNPVVIPNLDNPGRPTTCTHRDSLSATVDALLAAGAQSVRIVSGGGGRARHGRDPFSRLGYRQELWGRPALFVDIDAEEGAWSASRWIDHRGLSQPLRVPTVVAASRCLVSLGLPKTHDVFRVGLGLTNLGAVLDRDDRILLGLSNGASGEFLPWQGSAIGLLASLRGSLLRAWLGLRMISGGMRLTGPERHRLRSVERATHCLIALAAQTRPAVSLIDGFEATEGEGPRHGRRAALGTVIAGIDPVAVDAVAAAIMGYEPMDIAYLRLAHASGLGTADLSAITIVGDALVRHRRFRRHSKDPLLRLAGATAARPTAPPRPHYGSFPRERAVQVED